MSSEHLQAEAIADNLDAAVESALAQLNSTRAEAEIEVLQSPSHGLLGVFGKRPARVVVRLHDRAAIARQVTVRLLHLCGHEADVRLAEATKRIDLCLTSSDPSRLIGRHGQTLDALQTLVSSMTDRVTTDRTPILLDVDGYRERRQDFLQQLAHRLARKARQTGKPASSPVLNHNERRILHGLIKQEPGLASHSRDHERGRRVVVLLSQA